MALTNNYVHFLRIKEMLLLLRLRIDQDFLCLVSCSRWCSLRWELIKICCSFSADCLSLSLSAASYHSPPSTTARSLPGECRSRELTHWCNNAEGDRNISMQSEPFHQLPSRIGVDCSRWWTQKQSRQPSGEILLYLSVCSWRNTLPFLQLTIGHRP